MKGDVMRGNYLKGHGVPKWILIASICVLVKASNAAGIVLIDAIRGGAIIREHIMLIDSARVNTKDEDGFSALMVACGYGYKDVVLTLLDAKADVNARDNFGQTALAYASAAGNVDVAQMLLATDANVDSKNNNGVTALMIASGYGREGVVKLLLASHANVNVKDNDGQTALMYAAVEGHVNVVKLLLNADADINARDKYGETAVALAAFAGKEAMTEQFNDAINKSARMLMKPEPHFGEAYRVFPEFIVNRK